jgi:biopolymer transport protein ExbB
MFEGKSILEIFRLGGFTMYILLLCSVVSIAVILERVQSYYVKSKLKRSQFMPKVLAEIGKGSVDGAIRLCEKESAPFCSVVKMGLKKYGHDEKAISGAMEREIMLQTIVLERYTSIVGTIGNIAVYIGLFGTVLGIVRSFHNIASVGSGGISVVIGGVSESLVCTATGLMVAIPAVMAFNYFIKRIDNFVTEMEYCSSEILDTLTSKGN